MLGFLFMFLAKQVSSHLIFH